MILFGKPYAFDRNLGKAYNDFCSRAKDNEWICLMDGDCMFLASDYGHRLNEITTANPGYWLYAPVVNRVGKRYQTNMHIMFTEVNLMKHKQYYNQIKSTVVKDVSHRPPVSMPMFLFPKWVWEKVGGFDETGQILGVDVRFSKKITTLGGKIGLMKGFYMLHYYRLLEGRKDKSHIK